MPRERTWTRIYVDRMKLSSLSNYLGSDKKKDELGVKGWLKGPDHGKFDLERVFAKIPSTQVISDTDIDEISDKISMSKSLNQSGRQLLVYSKIMSPIIQNNPRRES